MKKLSIFRRLFILLFGLSISAQAEDLSYVRYGTENIDGLNIFYREAGDPSKQAVVLLHGFPTSSHMYRDFLSELGDEFYLIAPDYPGYGYSDKKSVKEYTYTFDNVAETMNQFFIRRGLNNYVIMIQGFGAPVGFQLATKHPEKVAGFIVMNGNIYGEGLVKETIEFLKEELTPENETKKMKTDFSLKTLKWQHTHSTRNPKAINPDA
ncbi:alpha/beta fold hydrolase [Agarilytica rhodophyticola]|uniref:alpha/beta fold hydrolase n=1 Tax=Agarilytica rhodophyticola TaxID=1737490 RepID=UPI001C1FF8BC|nr:alpha/beta fold hydrolase [Agarilytica rhodophyticola]